MARAAITSVAATPEGENVRFRWMTIFYGSGVAGVDFDNEATVLRTPAAGNAQVKAAIVAAIQERATALGYGNLQGKPQHVDELFHGL
jgi:hypothetical protein